MRNVVEFKREIQRLEDEKWEILLSRGQHAAVELWKPIDAKLDKLYGWWAHYARSTGDQGKLPFHRRSLS